MCLDLLYRFAFGGEKIWTHLTKSRRTEIVGGFRLRCHLSKQFLTLNVLIQMIILYLSLILHRARSSNDHIISFLNSAPRCSIYVLPDFPLTPDVPNVELESLRLDGLDVEALGGGDR